jgi:hypothetical protein
VAGAGLPRWLAHALVVIGWLLTPLLAWGASFFGLWVGAHLADRLSGPLVMMIPAVIGAGLLGFGTLWLWVRFMRRVPHLLAHHMASRVPPAPSTGSADAHR